MGDPDDVGPNTTTDGDMQPPERTDDDYRGAHWMESWEAYDDE